MVITFAHHKSLRCRFWCITINESGLARIANIVKEATLNFKGDLGIELVSPDGEDTYRSNEPDFFFDKSGVPQVISEVTISHQHYEAPLSCKVHLLAGADGRAELMVDGKDATAASGLFRELSRELESHGRGERMVGKVDGEFLF